MAIASERQTTEGLIMNFYTYMWLREDGTPYYVGKTNKLRRTYGEKHSVNPPTSSRIIVNCWESEDKALEMEKWFIALFGRKDNGTGVLRNHTDGGEGTSGNIRPEHAIEAQRSKMLGRVVSEETKQKIREAQIGNNNPSHKRAGDGHWNKGLVRSEETREKIREARKKQDMSHKKRTVCKRGHARTPDNVGANSTCKICKELLRKPRVKR